MNSRSLRRVLTGVAAYLVAAAALVWVFHDAQWAKMAKDMAALNWRWVAFGVLFDVLSYVSQGFRWRLLLKPLGRIGTLRTTQAVYAGLFINEILPMRIGEIARGYLVSRWMARPFTSVLPSMAMERLFEGIWLAAGIGVTAVFVPLPRDLARAGDVFGLVILALTGGVLFIMLRNKSDRPAEGDPQTGRDGVGRRLKALLGSLEGGLRSIGLSRSSLAAFFVSLLLFVCQAFSFWFIMKAYGLAPSFWVGAAVFLIIHFGTALPNAPANIGTYQLFCVLGLTLFGVDKTAAAGFSIVVFVVLTLPLWALGFFALGQSGMTLAAVKDKVRQLRSLK
jgi:glycosyltransferase 2 family protein